MCSISCKSFVGKIINQSEVTGKRILEVGSMDLNGSVRPTFEKYSPKQYWGVDMYPGPSVDQVCSVENLLNQFHKGSFDIVVTTEMLEHVKDWRTAIHNVKNLIMPGGILVLTTRSRGKLYHAYPNDFWRFEVEDMQNIFSDFEILALEKDPDSPGVFLKARKPMSFVERDLSDYDLYSIIKNRKMHDVNNGDIRMFRIVYRSKEVLKTLLPKRVIALLGGARASYRKN